MPTVPYRTLLLASVAALAMSGEVAGQTISTAVTGPVNVIAGTPLIVTGTGSILSSGANDGVVAGVFSPSVSNSGLIQAFGSGIPLDVFGQLGTLTNSGTIGSLTGSATAGIVLESIATGGSVVNNAGGQILVAGNQGKAVSVYNSGGSITNAAGGTIAATGPNTGPNVAIGLQ